MNAPPLTLSILHLRPSTLLLPPGEDPPSPTTLPNEPVAPSQPLPTFSPAHAYPAPYPDTILGSTLSISLDLANNKSSGNVMGVRMMCEIQSPSGRYRLGEVVHGHKEVQEDQEDTQEAVVLPELGTGESVRLDVEGEMKELGLHMIIVSVAWETLDGRRTFQRFFKYNVNAPLAIKTRIHQTSHPNTALDLDKREQVYLEILAQNVSPEGLVFDRVYLEAVHGMVSRSVMSLDATQANTDAPEEEKETRTLLPSETRQHLFLLSPAPYTTDSGSAPRSSFPPIHQPGTILPLGRLDLTWRSGPSHDPGRLQTSTLNRRIPVSSIPPSRTLSAASPSPGGRISPRPPTRLDGDDIGPEWEYDLVVLNRPKSVEVEKDFEITIRIGVRSTRVIDEEIDDPKVPPPPILGVQYLLRPPSRTAPSQSTAPKFTFSPPSRSATPMTRSGSDSSAASRPFSPLSQLSQTGAGSRPMTPVSSQLRQATLSNIGSPSASTLPLLPAPTIHLPSFPPPPVFKGPGVPVKPNKSGQEIRGEVQDLGASLIVLPNLTLGIVEEKPETTYADPIAPLRRWETTYEHKLRYIALDEGLAELGGLRVLLLDTDKVESGSTGREWDSLGDVWVQG